MPAWTSSVTTDRLLKPLTALLAALPLAWLGYAIAHDRGAAGGLLGADPGEAVVHFLGQWGLRLLLATLAVSSVRHRLHWPPVMRVRRLLGLFAFTYLALHLLAYLWFLLGFEWNQIGEDLAKRPYITVGALALLLLLPLAVTSTRGWQRRLRRNWQRLHRLIYPAAALGLLHLFWLTKDGYAEPLVYLVVLTLLLLERLQRALQRSSGRSRANAGQA
ncbi:MAG: protein-methionine-sulfoxide reductase heme-binding subunit MsrQ [Pseudomonadales bacterium]